MIEQINNHPKVKEARQHLQAARDGLTKAEQSVSRATQNRQLAEHSAARAIAAGQKPKRLSDLPDPVVLAQVVDEHRQAIVIAEQAERDALAEAKRDALEELRTKHVAAVKALRTKLLAAAEANAELRAIEDQAHLVRINGSPSLPRLSWPELVEGSPTQASKLKSWLRQAEAYLPTPIKSLATKTRRRLSK